MDLGEALGKVLDLYFGGDLEAAVALSGQVAGRITEVESVAEIIASTVAGFRATTATIATY